MSMGKGAILIFFRGQKLNAGSSTEAELIGIADALGIIFGQSTLWKLRAGVHNRYQSLFQDNKLTILLATNGRQSEGKKSK